MKRSPYQRTTVTTLPSTYIYSILKLQVLVALVLTYLHADLRCGSGHFYTITFLGTKKLIQVHQSRPLYYVKNVQKRHFCVRICPVLYYPHDRRTFMRYFERHKKDKLGSEIRRLSKRENLEESFYVFLK